MARVVSDVLGGIDMDPCGSPIAPQVVLAKRVITLPRDGLVEMWGPNTVYMNPPCGRAISKWVTKYMTEWRLGHFYAGIALVPARTDTSWWSTLTKRASLVAFFHGRLRFDDSMLGTATFPSAVVLHCGYSTVKDRFVNAFMGVGDVYEKVRGIYAEVK